jgi:hypothetical protein
MVENFLRGLLEWSLKQISRGTLKSLPLASFSKVMNRHRGSKEVVFASRKRMQNCRATVLIRGREKTHSLHINQTTECIFASMLF